jgi:FkbM family methyltransferase
MLKKLLIRLKYILEARLSLVYLNFSFSQEGEDMVLSRLLLNKKDKGVYVDVGCFHPVKYSNTYKFYLMGWRGVNIDAAPHVVDKFNKVRKRDINIRAAVNKEEVDLKYHAFNWPALNTFSEEYVKEYLSNPDVRLLGTEVITTQRLDRILDAYLPAGTQIDFMSIDVEGLDLQVLQSNNWNLYRPDYLVIENHKFGFNSTENDEISQFLFAVGYELHSKLNLSLIYKKTAP